MDLMLMSLEKHVSMEMCIFSVNFNFVDKSDILNIHKYLMTKNNMK